jgi:hypothetical protein
MGDLVKYHESITAELEAIKNRVRDLITVEHWLSDGEWKEAALRTILRRCLPNSVIVGRGFVVSRDRSSTQIDILVLRPDAPTIFRDGEFLLVAPDVPAAIVEVKTGIAGPQAWKNELLKLAANGKLCKEVSGIAPWLGLFCYDGNQTQLESALDAVREVYEQTQIVVNCIACGYKYFVRHWRRGEFEPGDDRNVDEEVELWRGYELVDLTPSYFSHNLIDSVCGVDRETTGGAWFAHENGKFAHRIAERKTPTVNDQ